MPSKKVFAQAIGNRDRKLFQFLFENKVATTKQLKNLFFERNCTQAAYRRLLALVRAGWLERGAHSGVSQRPQNIYALSAKAYETHVQEKESRARRLQLKSDSIEHDLALVDIRLCFEKNASVKKFYTENVLQSHEELANSAEFRPFVELRSDAAVDLLIGGEHRFLIPLEYEASLKSMERCEQKLRDYYLKYQGTAVFFICKNDGVLNRFVSIERKLSQQYKPKMYFALLTQIPGSAGEITFTKVQGDKYTIK